MSYDPECEKLVHYFLQDEPDLKADEAFVETVAQDIQTMIEDSISLYKADKIREQELARRAAPPT